jgi:hypothetical protein
VIEHVSVSPWAVGYKTASVSRLSFFLACGWPLQEPALRVFFGGLVLLLACKLSQAGDMLCILLCMVCNFWLERVRATYP